MVGRLLRFLWWRPIFLLWLPSVSGSARLRLTENRPFPPKVMFQSLIFRGWLRLKPFVQARWRETFSIWLRSTRKRILLVMMTILRRRRAFVCGFPWRKPLRPNRSPSPMTLLKMTRKRRARANQRKGRTTSASLRCLSQQVICLWCRRSFWRLQSASLALIPTSSPLCLRHLWRCSQTALRSMTVLSGLVGRTTSAVQKGICGLSGCTHSHLATMGTHPILHRHPGRFTPLSRKWEESICRTLGTTDWHPAAQDRDRWRQSEAAYFRTYDIPWYCSQPALEDGAGWEVLALDGIHQHL